MRQQQRGNRKAITAVEVSVVVGLTLLVAIIAGLQYARSQRRTRLSRTRASMRSLAVAIEAYYVDNGIYVGWGIGRPGPGAARTFNWEVTQKTGNRSGVGDLPSFLLNDISNAATSFMTLTTPIAYSTRQGGIWRNRKSPGYPVDPYCTDPGATFVHWCVFPGFHIPGGRSATVYDPRSDIASVGGVGWITISPGPDGDYDLTTSYTVYNPRWAQPSPQLLTGTTPKGAAFTYDPTNGLISGGDVWRVKQ
jgi:hypothetical protein